MLGGMMLLLLQNRNSSGTRQPRRSVDDHRLSSCVLLFGRAALRVGGRGVRALGTRGLEFWAISNTWPQRTEAQGVEQWH